MDKADEKFVLISRGWIFLLHFLLNDDTGEFFFKKEQNDSQTHFQKLKNLEILESILKYSFHS